MSGGPAFPVPDIDGSAVCHGMTLRDYFAAKAMQGAWASGRASLDVTATHIKMAEWAYAQADAMLRAREAT